MWNVVKVPFIILASCGLYVAATAPSEARTEERVPGENILEKRGLLSSLANMKVAFLILGGVEAAAILLNQWDMGRHWASVLAVKGRPENFVLTPMSTLGYAFIITGSLIRWRCYRELKSMFTFDLAIRKGHKLVTTGPYSIARHPSYTGGLLTSFGLYSFCAPGSWWAECGLFHKHLALSIFVPFTSVIVLGLFARMKKEDSMLKETFGKQWDEWAARVPYKLCPGIY